MEHAEQIPDEDEAIGDRGGGLAEEVFLEAIRFGVLRPRLVAPELRPGGEIQLHEQPGKRRGVDRAVDDGR